MKPHRLAERIRALEAERAGGPLAADELLRVLVTLQDRQDADVAAVDVHTADQPVTRVLRLPGEQLAALARRARPPGATMVPIFTDQAAESEAGEALRLMLGMSRRLRQEAASWR